MVVLAGNLALPMLMIYPQVCPRVLYLEQKIREKYLQPNSRLGLTGICGIGIHLGFRVREYISVS